MLSGTYVRTVLLECGLMRTEFVSSVLMYLIHKYLTLCITCDLNVTWGIQSQSLGRFSSTSPTYTFRLNFCQGSGSLNTATVSRRFLCSWLHTGFLMRCSYPGLAGGGGAFKFKDFAASVHILEVGLFGKTIWRDYLVSGTTETLLLATPFPQPIPLLLGGRDFCPSSLIFSG